VSWGEIAACEAGQSIVDRELLSSCKRNSVTVAIPALQDYSNSTRKRRRRNLPIWTSILPYHPWTEQKRGADGV